MKQPRFDYRMLSKGVYQDLTSAFVKLKQASVDETLLELVLLRVSQINGCAYCLELHSKALRDKNFDQHKLDVLAAWQLSDAFTETERLALAWADSVTKLAENAASDALYQALQRVFTEQQISDLTMAIGLMNLFNRIAISTRQ